MALEDLMDAVGGIKQDLARLQALNEAQSETLAELRGAFADAQTACRQRHAELDRTVMELRQHDAYQNGCAKARKRLSAATYAWLGLLFTGIAAFAALLQWLVMRGG